MSAFVGSGLLISRFLLPKFIKRYGMNQMILTGLFILIICGSSLLIFSKLGYLTFLLSVAGIFFSYTFIVLCASAISMTPFTDKRGSAGAVYSCSQIALAFAVNSIVSLLSDNAVEILDVSYIALPVLGIYLFRKIQSKQDHIISGVSSS